MVSHYYYMSYIEEKYSSPKSLIFTPAIDTEPDSTLTSLYKITAKLDFPAPVRPTMPIFSLG